MTAPQPAVRWRLLSALDGLRVPGARRAAPDRLVLPDGRTVLALSGPRRRTWDGVRLVRDEPVEARPTDDGWQFTGIAEVDVLEVAPGVAMTAAPEPLTILGAFTELGGPTTLGRFLVGGQVLDPTSFADARCPSEQTALGLYRAARLRGGTFWQGVAASVARWTAERVSGERLVHDLLGSGETHTRFVADALLLLAAAGDDDALPAAWRHLDALAVGSGGERWWRHDSLEDGSDLVLNTHLLALLVRRAVGATDGDGVEALHRALALRPPLVRSIAHATHLLTGDVAGGVFDARRRPWVGALAHGAEVRAARERQRRPHLLLPGGRTARDVRPQPAPAYHTVNAADLASYALVTGDPVVRRAARGAARYARRSGHWHGLLRQREPVVLLVPAILWRLGEDRAAHRWATRLRAQGWAPAVGWPGYVDRPWPRLPAGAL